jgi:hypothetical protein
MSAIEDGGWLGERNFKKSDQYPRRVNLLNRAPRSARADFGHFFRKN